MALQCRVKLLDGSDFLLDLEKKEVGKFVFDQVLRRLSLPEKDKDYFGVEYEDEQKVPQWLDLSKQVKKQLKKPPFTLMFKVKYYPLDPVPHQASRTHFYRQFRRDLIEGKMKCPTHSVSDVVACILQADMGDFESTEQDIEFMTDQRLLIDQSLENAAVQDEVATLHKLHKGKTPQEAVKAFLRKVRELETYGIKLYDVKYDDSTCQLGLSPHGVSVFRRNRRIFVYDWLMVSQISFKAKKFIVMIEKEIGGDMQLVFELDSMKSSKELWSTSRGYAEFYTEPRRRLQEEPDPQTNVRSPGAQGTTAGDHFNFPAPPQPSELNQRDTSKSMEPAQKVQSLPRYLPTSKDPVADALRLNRHKKARSTSPEDVTNTSHSTSEAPTSPTDDGPSGPAENEGQERFQYPNSYHQQYQQQHHQQSHDPNQWSHDPNQWSHGRMDEAAAQHYDSLKCRDDYLAQQIQIQHQQQQQQTHGEINAHITAAPPPPAPRSTASDLNPAQASRSHSTINPEDLSSQDQDMAGSLLDLADELGAEAESPSTGQNRRLMEDTTTTTNALVQQAMDRNGRFIQESPRTIDRQVGGYHSYTLPHSFSSGHGGGRSPRMHNDGSSDGDSGPPKPPRTDYPPHPPKGDYSGGGGGGGGNGVMQGNSPYLPGSSLTTGRQHQKKRNLVRNWVQDQQLRTYQSSSSPDSSARGSPANLRHLQQSSPDIRASGGQQNGRLSGRSSLGSMGRSPGTSPSHLRSHDTRNRSSDSSPSHMRPSVPSASSHQRNTGQPSIRSHSHSPNQQHAGVSGSIPPPGRQDDAKSDSSPPQEAYRRRTSETLNQMQSDPQVPMLIQQIDELMGGLLDSPTPERKEQPSATQTTATSNSFNMNERSPLTGMNGGSLGQGIGVTASESPFLSNINPADFLRDEEIEIDPRNYLNTPSPEPNVLDLKSITASAEMAASGLSSGAFKPSPLIGGGLSSKLQQAMDEEADYHDPPPPPPHLMALTQGFKGGDRPSGSRAKKQPPAVSPKPQSSASARAGGPQQTEKTEQRKRPAAKEPISQYDPSNLPPEIARFVNRVRHSFDGSDTTQQPQHGRQPSGEEMRPRKFNDLGADRPVDKGTETRVEVSPTYDVPRSSISPTFDALKVEVAASSHGQVPASVERVTITPEEPDRPTRSTNLSTPQQQNGRPSSAEISPTTGSYPASAAVYPEAYSPVAGSKEQDHHSRSTEADSGIGGSAGSGGQQLSSGGPGTGADGSVGGMYSYAHYRQSSQDKRDQAMQQQQQQQQSQQQTKGQQLPRAGGQNQQQMSWDAETQRSKNEVVQPQPQQQQHQQQQQQQPSHQQYQLRSQQPAKNTSVSLPRGQALGYGAGPPPPPQDHRLNRESHGSSDGSTPTTPQAHSDLAIPHVHTQAKSPIGGAPGYKYQPYTGQPSSNARSARGYYPPPQQQQQQQQQGYYPLPPQDIRRAQTFSMGQGQPRPTRMAHYRQHPGGEDSLPNSPTYFAQNPPRLNDRGMLSPNTMANNRSFQEHLETLNSARHGRKMRVLDWMQKQQQVDPHHMVKDPSAGTPTEPYHKQSHIYASAAEPDPQPQVHVPNPAEQRRPGSAQGQLGGYHQPQERGRLNTFPYSHSAAHAYPQRPPQQAQGIAQRAQVDSRGRGYMNVPPHSHPHGPSPTGTHSAPYPQPPMGSGGNVGRMAGTPANAQNLPTAKYEKDYYILDV